MSLERKQIIISTQFIAWECFVSEDSKDTNQKEDNEQPIEVQHKDTAEEKKDNSINQKYQQKRITSLNKQSVILIIGKKDCLKGFVLNPKNCTLVYCNISKICFLKFLRDKPMNFDFKKI